VNRVGHVIAAALIPKLLRWAWVLHGLRLLSVRNDTTGVARLGWSLELNLAVFRIYRPERMDYLLMALLRDLGMVLVHLRRLLVCNLSGNGELALGKHLRRLLVWDLGRNGVLSLSRHWILTLR
jgi:hypothetical protein